MKSFVKKLKKIKLVKYFANINYVTKIRNTINFYPVDLYINSIENSGSISDDFCWRTDNGFKTIFNYADILKIFYDINDSEVEIFFYDFKNILIKKININKLDYSNKLVIDSVFLKNLESYGKFNIFHKTNKLSDKKIISNKCYLGFSLNNNLPSFVHGNASLVYKSFNGETILSNFVKTSFRKNQIYQIQNYFNDFYMTELFFNNPTVDVIKIQINNKFNFLLNPRFSKIVDITGEKEINILSSSGFIRPYIFNYKNDKFLDVYHS